MSALKALAMALAPKPKMLAREDADPTLEGLKSSPLKKAPPSRVRQSSI